MNAYNVEKWAQYLDGATVHSVKSKKGFYVGDICYVLCKDIYRGVWGEKGYEDGKFDVPSLHVSFAVGGTAYGDGVYCDDAGGTYPVDAGNIGIVPLEICDDKGIENGSVFEVPGDAMFISKDGFFGVILPSGTCITIDTIL